MKSFLKVILVIFFINGSSLKADINKLNYYVFNLQFDKAEILIEKYKKKQESKIRAYYYENYIDFIKVLFSQKASSFENYIEHADRIYDKVENLPKNSPQYLYTLAQIKFHNSVLNYLFGNNFSSAWEMYRSYKLVKENKKKYPYFLHNKKLSSVYNILFSTVPEDYKWLLTSFNISSDYEKGIKELKKYSLVLDKDTSTQVEAIVYYSLVSMHFSDNKTYTYKYLKQNSNYKKNTFLFYVYCLNAALSGKNEELLLNLNSFNQKKDEFNIPFFSYLKASTKLNNLDLTAKNNFLKFLKKYKGTNYLKTVYHKLSWIYLLEGNTEKYKYYNTKVKTLGTLVLEKDKQALKEAQKSIPNRNLLAARLLFDGSNFKRAIEMLNKCEYKQLNLNNKIEYNYRKARIHHKLSNTEDAVTFYKKTIELGKNTDFYFAPYSALNLAEIHKSKKNTNKAASYYKLALRMNTGEYKNSIEIKAKTGLKSLL